MVYKKNFKKQYSNGDYEGKIRNNKPNVNGIMK
jgi:hypothetical protein